MAGGPQGGMSYMVANAPRGMSTNDMWAHVDGLLQKAFIIKGDMVGAQRAREYVFQMQHAGANQMLMQAYRSMAVGDAAGAAQLLAKSHAFVPDGSTMAFKVGPNNTLWGQRFVDATGQPVGGPLQITAQGIGGMLNQTLDPQQFLKTLNTERGTIAKIAHNQNMEGIRNKAIDVGAGTATANRDAANLRAAQQQTGADTRLQQTLDERAREANQADETRRLNKAASDAKVAQATRNAITKQANEYFLDPSANQEAFAGADLTPQQRNTAADLFGGLRTYNPDMQAGSAAALSKDIMNHKFDLQEMKMKDGKTQYAVINQQGNTIAYLPQSAMTPHGVQPGQQPQQAPAR